MDRWAPLSSYYRARVLKCARARSFDDDVEVEVSWRLQAWRRRPKLAVARSLQRLGPLQMAFARKSYKRITNHALRMYNLPMPHSCLTLLTLTSMLLYSNAAKTL